MTHGSKIARKNTSVIRFADDTTQIAEGEEELKSFLTRVKEKSEKTGLKLSIPKTKIMACGPITSWQIDGEKNGNSDRLYFLELQNHCGCDCSHEIKRHLLLGTKVVTNLDNILKSKTSLCWQRYT